MADRLSSLGDVVANPLALLKAEGKSALVLFSYEAQEEDELSLEKGAKIRVIKEKTGNEGWSLGMNANGTRGIFPSNYVSIEEAAPPPPRPKRGSVLTTEELESTDEPKEDSFVVVDGWDLGVPPETRVLGQKGPLWRHPCFIDMIADPYVDGKRIDSKTLVPKSNILDRLSTSLNFFSTVCDILCRAPHLSRGWKKIVWDMKHACS